MFTGIVKYVGKVVRLQKRAFGLWLWISPVPETTEVGDSIAVNGVCLTVEEISKIGVRFFVGQDTVKNTTLGQLRVGDEVNIESALRLGDKVGGHLVSGHIHCVGRIIGLRPVGNAFRMRIRIPTRMINGIKEKDSIAVDGVSLTVQRLGRDWFEVMIIPETLRRTVLSRRKIASRVNIEFNN